MLRDEKLAYQDELEKYMEENEIYEIFETMMKTLIISKPDDPIPHLLDTLQKPQTKRIFIMGPPGSKRKEHILTLADNFEDFKYEAICVGDLLNKEITKKSDMGKKIVAARKTYSYPEDDIVIEIVTKSIEQLEKEKRNWIIEGFPRTRKQALALTEMGFIPDRMILLDVKDELTKERIKQNLTSEEAIVEVDPEKIPSISQDALEEYQTHIEGVKEIYKGIICCVDGNQKQDIVLQEIARTLKLKIVNTPKRAPKIILFGVPGSGVSTQAEKISKKFNVIHIQVNSLLKSKVENYWETTKKGDPIPDKVVLEIVRERLEMTDAKINGFVLDGFPLNSNQMSFLINDWGIKPSQLIFLEVSDHKAYERLEDQMFDPVTGISYSITSNLPEDETILKRLMRSPENEHHVLKKSIKRYKEFILELQDTKGLSKTTINGENDPCTVFKDICSEIDS
ncbi:unnamed protein product [Moneuplotes crassus]|uniref:Adenylate kinase n=1 Tax=Euplotes crassus TaxID=5936 RepID=A0AAD1UGV2_EUPCR|nr:unnamed protein product [Moneuplotes crassus]